MVGIWIIFLCFSVFLVFFFFSEFFRRNGKKTWGDQLVFNGCPTAEKHLPLYKLNLPISEIWYSTPYSMIERMNERINEWEGFESNSPRFNSILTFISYVILMRLPKILLHQLCLPVKWIFPANTWILLKLTRYSRCTFNHLSSLSYLPKLIIFIHWCIFKLRCLTTVLFNIAHPV